MNENLFGKIQQIDNRRETLQTQMKGVRHAYRMQPMVPLMQDEPLITVTTEVNQSIEKVECHISEPEIHVISFELVETKWDLLNWSYYQVWQAKLPKQPTGTRVCYQIKALPADGTEAILADDGEVFSYLVGEMPTPEWAKEAIIYQVFPDRFNPGEGREWNEVNDLKDVYGGTVPGITEKLDYIADLGFNTIWLNPFFPDTTHHCYHATDYFQVNPRMGTLEDIRDLVDMAHSKGIRLILDFVANHLGKDHPFFREAQQDKNSDYVNWFFWKKWPEDYECYFKVKELPKINVDYPAARQYLFESVRFWLTEIGFDGLRLDHADGPSMDFWLELRQYVHEIKPDAWIFGEVVKPPPDLLIYQGRMHGMLDFHLAKALRDTFGFGKMNLAEFDHFLDKHDSFFPANFIGPSFLDNHDMDRFSLIAKDDYQKIKQAMLCLMTLRNPPIIFYGTEVGLEQGLSKDSPTSLGMAECRIPMVWDERQDQGLKEYLKKLIAFRKAHPVIWQGKRKTVHLDAQKGIYAYTISNQDETVLVAFNLSDSDQSIDLKSRSYSFDLACWEGKVEVIQSAS
jgi:glycosidase